jgi:hypothetical protein
MTLGYCVMLLSIDLYAGKALLVADLLLGCFECCCEAAGFLVLGAVALECCCGAAEVLECCVRLLGRCEAGCCYAGGLDICEVTHIATKPFGQYLERTRLQTAGILRACQIELFIGPSISFTPPQ